jgi:uncharacterized protein (DUF4415 family)
MSKRGKQTIDPEIVKFEEALLRSLDQATLGEGRVNTPQQIVGRRGRPVGSVKAKPKIPTTIRFDQDVLDALKASGRGWQTRVNEAMRDWLARQSKVN